MKNTASLATAIIAYVSVFDPPYKALPGLVAMLNAAEEAAEPKPVRVLTSSERRARASRRTNLRRVWANYTPEEREARLSKMAAGRRAAIQNGHAEPEADPMDAAQGA